MISTLSHVPVYELSRLSIFRFPFFFLFFRSELCCTQFTSFTRGLRERPDDDWSGGSSSQEDASSYSRNEKQLISPEKNFASICATWYIGRGSTHHVLIRWQIYPDWGDSWPWEHARFRSTSCDGGKRAEGPRTGSAHT